MALESIRCKKYTTRTECWSFGVSAWEMFEIYDPDHVGKHAQPYDGIESVEDVSCSKYGIIT